MNVSYLLDQVTAASSLLGLAVSLLRRIMRLGRGSPDPASSEPTAAVSPSAESTGRGLAPEVAPILILDMR